jgi:TRAP-type transport system periplasmic protein
MVLRRRFRNALLAASAAGLVASGSFAVRAQEVSLTMVYPFPDFLIYTKMCKELAQKITDRGKGLVKITVLPFNSVKMFQQPTAVKSGRIDLACTPAAFYARAVPENEVISTSNSSPARTRANGGIAMIDQLQQKAFNVKYLGWTASGGRFRIYMKDAPKWTSDGLLDLRGVKLRDNPIYGAFFRALNASTHPMSSTQVYSALEKGVVNASAWATIGIKGLKWDKFLRHAVQPEFYQTDIGWIMNLDRWRGMSAKARDLMQSMIITQENEARARLEKMAAEEEVTLKKEGMQFHTVPNAKRYLQIAVDSAYDRIVGRLKKAGRDTAQVAKLRTLFQE